MPKPARTILIMLAAGAAGAYYFDSKDGAERRQALREWLVAVLGPPARQVAEDIEQQGGLVGEVARRVIDEAGGSRTAANGSSGGSKGSTSGPESSSGRSNPKSSGSKSS